MEPYHSEYEQDKWLHENIFHNKVNGVFVEIGALDGVFHSNTNFFEKEYNWTGICVEPNPVMFNDMLSNRSCIRVKAAITDSTGSSDFLAINDVLRGWSGIVRLMEPEHLQRINTEVKSRNLQTIYVNTLTLNELLDKFSVTNIDYLSIDVEGAEYTILSVFDFDRFNIDILEVEINFDNKMLDDFILSKNFVKLITLGVSNIYRKR